MSIYIGKDYSAMQGPCDSGYHVPTATERSNFLAICTTLGAFSLESIDYSVIKIPFGGYLDNFNASVSFRDSRTRYWSCVKDSNTIVKGIWFVSGIQGSFESNSYPCSGSFIRPFKDTTAIPDSNRTVLYQGTGNAGIYHDSTNGLISASSDGSTWITIADKNLGATTVYNYGDTLSESNCGKYYQRGNNYGFAFNGSITTTSGSIDASTYGPGNYYSSSTFRTGTIWDSSDNYNLRGGVTGVKPGEVQNIYIGEYKTRHYDYTFKGKTAAEIGNEWTTQVGTIAVNSDGVTGTSSQEMRISKDIASLSTAKRIIINSTVVGINSANTAGNVGIGKGTGWGNGTTIFCVFGSQYGGIHARINYNGTDFAGNSIGNATASTYKTTLTIDLEQKTIVGSISGLGDSTLSLSDAQVSDIRTYTYLVCYTSLNRSTISDVSIDIIE